MRASFNALIEGVREYFIVIDEKLKQIGVVMESKLLEERPRDTGGNQDINILMQDHFEISNHHESSFRIFSGREAQTTQ